MATTLPPAPINESPGSFAWQQWYLSLQAILTGTSGTIAWALVDKTGSNITDIASRDHNNLAAFQGGIAGERYHLTATQAGLLSSTQTANTVLAGPSSGGAAVATFRTLVAADIQTKGSWTPADNSGAALAFTGVSANYTQLGNMIFAYATWTYPVTASGANASISGLPVASANANYAQVPSIVDTSASITGGLVCVPIKNTTTASFDVGTPFGPATNLQLSTASIAMMLIYPAT